MEAKITNLGLPPHSWHVQPIQKLLSLDKNNLFFMMPHLSWPTSRPRDLRYKEEDLGKSLHAHSRWVWFEEAQTNTMPSAMEEPVHPRPSPWIPRGHTKGPQGALCTRDSISVELHLRSLKFLAGLICLNMFNAKQLSPHSFRCAATCRRKIPDSHLVQVQLPPSKAGPLDPKLVAKCWGFGGLPDMRIDAPSNKRIKVYIHKMP